MNKARIWWLLPVLLAGIIRCGSTSRTAQSMLKISSEGREKNIILKKLTPAGEIVPVDTIEMHDGKGEYVFGQVVPDLYFLSRGQTNLPFFLENHNIRVEIDTAFGLKNIEGGRENTWYAQYYRHTDSLEQLQKEIFVRLSQVRGADKEKAKRELFAVQEELNRYRLDFARKHPSLAGVFVLLDLSYDKNSRVKELFDIYLTYPGEVKKTAAGKFLTKRLNDLSVGALGMRMQNFTAPGPDGKLISLYSVMGKVTIVDFWASWCKPCRAQNPHLAELYRKYHDQGLNIISVSLDHNRTAWLKAMEKDGMNWYHVSHLKGWKEPVAQQFHVRFIPQTFIIDKNGILRYKNLRGKLLEDKVKELLAE